MFFFRKMIIVRHCKQITSEICLSKLDSDCVVISRRSPLRLLLACRKAGMYGMEAQCSDVKAAGEPGI